MKMKKVIVVMPAFNAERTLRETYANLPQIFDEVILCDDASSDSTYELSKKLGIVSFRNERNKGYGGNQKLLYKEAVARGAGVIVMVHPDNQYRTDCVPLMVDLIRNEGADMVLGSRMHSALENGMPWWKFLSNRFLSFLQNAIFRSRLSEFHSGLRVYRAGMFSEMPYRKFSDGFVFDSEVIAWLFQNKRKIREVTTECFYTEEASSVGFFESVKYGLGTLWVLARYVAGKFSLRNKPLRRET